MAHPHMASHANHDSQLPYPIQHQHQQQSPQQQQQTSPLPYSIPTDPSLTAQQAAAAASETWSDNESVDQDDKDESKKRKRPMSVSCELCKQRKVRCDRGQPTCGWCARNGQICEYKERKKPGLRAGYGRELEARLDRLESVLQAQQHALSQLTNGAIQPINTPSPHTPNTPQEANVFANSRQFQQPEIPRSDPSNNTPKTEYTPQPGVESNLRSGFPGFNGSAYPQSSQASYPQSPQEQFQRPEAQMIQQGAQPYYTSPGAPLQSPSLSIPSAASAAAAQDQDLPPYDLLYSLADLYFKHINTWCPILHRKSTLDTLFGPSSLDEADRILLHSIVATTLRFSRDHRLSPESKAKYYLTSKQRVLLYGLENSSVKALQALVILALDLCGSSNGPPGWNLLALITRSAVQLGLSIEATSPAVSPRVPSIYTLRAMVLPESNSWIEEESRRRLFWMIYILDRYSTITTAFEFALDEKEIDRKLPCRDDMFSRNQAVETRWFKPNERAEKGADRPENLGSFSFYVEVIGILSRIHQFLKKPVDITATEDVEKWQSEYRELDAMLSNWKNSLPREYGNVNRLFDSSTSNKIVNVGWVMLHATYWTTVSRLHSSAAYPARRSPIFWPSYNASQQCLAAVEAISSLSQHVKNNKMLDKLGPPFAFSVWVASRLLLVHSCTIDHQINPTMHFFVSTLREMGAFWKVAENYAILLQRVLDEFAESERAAVTRPDGERTTPSSVRILADMRRCAYDLDFLISRQPRLTGSISGASGTGSISAVNANNNGAGMPNQPTPTTRTPAPNELEYLDVFDFFNMPRLPIAVDVSGANGANGGGLAYGGNNPAEIQTFGFGMMNPGAAGGMGGAGEGVGEFNVGSFMLDPATDWFQGS